MAQQQATPGVHTRESDEGSRGTETRPSFKTTELNTISRGLAKADFKHLQAAGE